MLRFVSRSLIGLAVAACAAGADAPKKTAKEALQPFNDFIGSWRGTGVPEGTRQQKQAGFWSEGVTWEWQFKGRDAWLKVVFDKGKHFADGELRYLPDKDEYRLKLRTAAKDELEFSGPFRDKRLTLERADDKRAERQRLVLTPLHANRFLYAYEVKPDDRPAFTRVYQVGATKEGVPFAAGDGKPECVVSGGLGTIKVTYMGQTYYVCCGGCRDAFNEEPAKYVEEFEEKRKKSGK
jgi:hypothetical protein